MVPVRTQAVDVPPTTTLAGYMAWVVEKVQEEMGKRGISVPKDCYWTMGATLGECESMVVSLQQAYYGLPGAQDGGPMPCPGPRSFSYTIEIWRCAKVSGARGSRVPSTQIMADAAIGAKDIELLIDIAADLDPYGGKHGVGVLVEPQGSTGNMLGSIGTYSFMWPMMTPWEMI